MSMTGRSAESANPTSQLSHMQASWGSRWIGVGAIGAPIAASCLHPLIGLILIALQVAMIMTIFGAALFGTPTISARAFRLLRWLAGRSEPACPAPSPTATGSDGGTPSEQ
jgi:hypothetical protein